MQGYILSFKFSYPTFGYNLPSIRQTLVGRNLELTWESNKTPTTHINEELLLILDQRNSGVENVHVPFLALFSINIISLC